MNHSNKTKKRKGFVYLIRCNDYFKIGVSSDPCKRLCALQTSSPYKLELIRYYKHDDIYEEEKFWHLELNSHRIRNEWFKLPKEKTLDFQWFTEGKQEAKIEDSSSSDSLKRNESQNATEVISELALEMFIAGISNWVNNCLPPQKARKQLNGQLEIPLSALF